MPHGCKEVKNASVQLLSHVVGVMAVSTRNVAKPVKIITEQVLSKAAKNLYSRPTLDAGISHRMRKMRHQQSGSRDALVLSIPLEFIPYRSLAAAATAKR